MEIKKLFDQLGNKTSIDRRKMLAIQSVRTGFMNRNDDHINFFSGNLLGVYPIRYKTSDKEVWLNDIAQINERDIKEGVSNIKHFEDDWVRANDPINLSSIWLLHKFNHSNLSNRDKETALRNTVLMLQYKFLSSLMAHWFKYPADKSTAIATYEALSRKFELKLHESWQGLLEHRTTMILDPKGIHYETFNKLNDDAAIIYMIYDIQERLKKIVKNLYMVFLKVKEQNLQIRSTSQMIEIDGKMELRDLTRTHTDYLRYLEDIITDKPTFIREELIDIICEIITSLPPQILKNVLIFCSDQYNPRNDRLVKPLLSETLLHAFIYLSENQGIMSNPKDIGGLILRLKNIYMASRMSDEHLLKMKELADKIVKKSAQSRNPTTLSAARTGLQTYIVLRAFSKNYYS